MNGMNGVAVLIIGIVILVVAYLTSGRWLAKQWGIDPTRKTPAYEQNDGVDYVPAKAPVLMGHHFSSIAGAGPINGPIQAAVFGWVPVLLWVLIGGIFFGAVHDFGALFASIRHKGQSIGEVIADTMGSKAKKLFIIFSYLTLLLVVTLLPVQAHAAGATLTGTAAPQAGDTVTLTLSVPSKVYGLTADLSYSGNLSFTNYNCSVSGWSIVVNNNKFSVYGTSSSSGGLVTIKMKGSGSAKEGDALTATFSNIVVSDGNSDTSLDSASWSGKVGAAPSGNCNLSSLSCSNATLSPSFSSSTTYYTCTVPFAVEKLDLNYKKADNSATVSVSGNELAVGVNTVTIKVTAANGATKSYTIDATRQQDPNYKPSTDASIAALTLEGATLSPVFTPTVTDYIAYVPYETKQVTIAATAKDEKAQGITGTGEVRLSATEAETVLTVTGTAEDGKAKQNYTIHVLRMPAYTGIVPTVEVIDPATIPEVPPLEIPGTIAMPLIGEVKTVYVAIAAAVLLWESWR